MSVELPIGGVPCRLDTATPATKQAAFDRAHDWLRGLPEHDMRREMNALCARHGVDEAAICRDLCMSWDELKSFAEDPLITIGAHSITHCNLAHQTEENARHDGAALEKTKAAPQQSGGPAPFWPANALTKTAGVASARIKALLGLASRRAA